MGNALKGKVAVVTGAGGGIGRGVCLAMAAEGAKVVVNDLGVATDGTGQSMAPAEKVVHEIKQAGGEAVVCFETVSTMAGGERIIKKALDTYGRLDIVVTCAGILRDRMIFNMGESDWDAVMATHLKGTFALVRPASAIFRQQRSGRIITFTSTAGLFGNPGQANYGAAKGAISGMTKVVALDLGKYGVTVNAISPMAATRMTMTPEVMKALEMKKKQGITREGFEGGFSPDLTQLDPLDVAPVAVYLASDAGANVNGQIIYVAGPQISLLAIPRPIKTIYKSGRWTIDELINTVPHTLMVGVANPAPPSPDRIGTPAKA